MTVTVARCASCDQPIGEDEAIRLLIVGRTQPGSSTEPDGPGPSMLCQTAYCFQCGMSAIGTLAEEGFLK